jgi:predicted HicB family RNase H-like nuclease
MFHQSIDNYLQMCANTGKTPDKEFKGTFNIRISPELHRGISLQAAQQGISLNQYVLNALENSLPSTQN